MKSAILRKLKRSCWFFLFIIYCISLTPFVIAQEEEIVVRVVSSLLQDATTALESRDNFIHITRALEEINQTELGRKLFEEMDFLVSEINRHRQKNGCKSPFKIKASVKDGSPGIYNSGKHILDEKFHVTLYFPALMTLRKKEEILHQFPLENLLLGSSHGPNPNQDGLYPIGLSHIRLDLALFHELVHMYHSLYKYYYQLETGRSFPLFDIMEQIDNPLRYEQNHGIPRHRITTNIINFLEAVLRDFPAEHPNSHTLKQSFDFLWMDCEELLTIGFPKELLKEVDPEEGIRPFYPELSENLFRTEIGLRTRYGLANGGYYDGTTAVPLQKSYVYERPPFVNLIIDRTPGLKQHMGFYFDEAKAVVVPT